MIDVLTVDCIRGHMQRRTELVHRPAAELKGQAHAPAPERKKSELIEMLAKLFADAAKGKLDDKQLAARVNSWLPSNFREPNE